MAKVAISRVIEVVESVLGGSKNITVDLNDAALAEVVKEIPKSRVRLALSKRGIVVDIPVGATTVSFSRIGALGSAPSPAAVQEEVEAKDKPKSRPTPNRTEHTYVPPKFTSDILNVLLDESGAVISFVGPTGTGKTTLADYLAKELGQELIRVECFPGMTAEDFVGEKTIEVDEATGQNYIKYQDGPVIEAMTTGLDDDGNEVGKAAILLIDEAGSMPTSSIIVNGLLGAGPRRRMYLNRDGGREVVSHSKFRVILAANNTGRGAQTAHETMYAAQLDAVDISTLDRIGFSFKFGYSRSTEKRIAMEKIGNDKVVQQLLDFRDGVRDNIRAGKLFSPFSTRTIVNLSNGYRIFNDLNKALYYGMFTGKIAPQELPIYNEMAVAKLGKDLLREFSDEDMDYMD